MSENEIRTDAQERQHDQEPAAGVEQVAPWEQIEPGRYMPRRVRGSCHGRVLG